MAYEFNIVHRELTFEAIQFYLVFPQAIKDFLQVFFMKVKATGKQ